MPNTPHDGGWRLPASFFDGLLEYQRKQKRREGETKPSLESGPGGIDDGLNPK